MQKLFDQVNIRLFAIIDVLLVIAIVFFVIHLHKNSPHTTTGKKTVSNSDIITFNTGTSVTLPCSTHASKLKSSLNQDTTAYGADCQAVRGTLVGSVYGASELEFGTDSQYQEEDYNYCTAQTSYTGANKSTIYIVDPLTETINGKTFQDCGISADNKQAYEIVATTMSGSNNLVLQINLSKPESYTMLHTALVAYAKTTQYK